MTENIKHMREIVEHNDLTSDMTRAEALAVLDLIDTEMRERTEERDNFQQSVRELVQACKDANEDLEKMTALAYHTAPGEMEFGGEGWTWRQQAQRHLMRMGEMEKRIEELEGIIWNASL